MTVMARQFAAEPRRTAAETWGAIIAVACAENQEALALLQAATGVAATLIAEEAFMKRPLVVEGGGVRLRVYCVYGESALLDEDINEAPLASNPFERDGWRCHFPCDSSDLKWVSRKLKEISPSLLTYDVDAEVVPGSDATPSSAKFTIDLEALGKL